MWEGIRKLCFSNNYAGYLFHFSVCLKYLTCTKLYLQGNRSCNLLYNRELQCAFLEYQTTILLWNHSNWVPFTKFKYENMAF